MDYLILHEDERITKVMYVMQYNKGVEKCHYRYKSSKQFIQLIKIMMREGYLLHYYGQARISAWDSKSPLTFKINNIFDLYLLLHKSKDDP